MKTFKTFAFVMVAAWVAASAYAKTGADDRSLGEAAYQQAAAPNKSTSGHTANYSAAKKAKAHSTQAKKKSAASCPDGKKKCTGKKKATVKKATAKKAVAKAPAKKAVQER